ncbi:MAG: radical SAM protein [Deltaproteobacteria bacterium]|nr:radical SAM protein [Deltaproteobacteria bacterium]
MFNRSVAGQFPTRVQFELTYRCNIHCVHCYTDPFNTLPRLRRELGLEEILRILDELKAAGTFWITLTGGEAFVHPRFKEIYLAARERGFVLHLYTNGTTVTESLADFLAEDPPFTIDVSCHGATEETFERITQVRGSFQRFQEGVRRILQRNLPLKIKTKAMTENRHELKKIKEWVEGLGQKFNLYTTIHPRLDGDLSSTAYRLSPEEILDLEQSALPVERETGRCREDLFNAPSDDRLFRCGCGTNTCTISPYGRLRACTHTTWPERDLRTMPFQQAFSELAKEIRQAAYRGDTPCRRCSVYRFCNKNPVTARIEAGSMEAPVAHYCDLAYGRAERMGQGR